MTWSWRLSVWVFSMRRTVYGICQKMYATWIVWCIAFGFYLLFCSSFHLPPPHLPVIAPASGPIRTSSQFSAEELVRNIFVRGGCNNISNIRAIGATDGVGFFENGLNSIGLDRGIILSTGPIAHAAGPNNATDKSGNFNYSDGDPDLDILSGITVRDRIGLEFDFVPLDSFVTFRYVFASEEYCEFVGSVYNDVFGFFISGPGISGPFSNNSRNIALIPGSNSFVSINTVNHQLNEPYFVRNDLSADALQCGIPSYTSPYLPSIQYDGFTRQLTASLKLIPCETYHLRLVVADVGDNFYDSAVFLEAESFNIGGAVSTSGYSTANSSAIATEGCGDGYFQFRRVDVQNRSTPITVRYAVSTALSTAIEGEDFAPLPGIATIPAGQIFVNVPVHAFNDQIPEPLEHLVIELDIPCACYTDTAVLHIVDAPPLSLQLPDAAVCNDEPAQLTAFVSAGRPAYVYQWSTGATEAAITVNPALPAHYSVTVTDACGSSAVDTAYVDITAPPEAYLSGYAEVCEGDTAYLPVVFSGTPPWQLALSIDGVVQPVLQGITSNPFLMPATQEGVYRIEKVLDAYCEGIHAGEGQVDLMRLEIHTEATPVTCFGNADGAISAVLGGGTPPYQFFWSHGLDTTLNPQHLAAGGYALQVDDARGCRKVVKVQIEEPSPLAPVVFTCNDLANPAFVFSATGGRPPYRYGVNGEADSDFSLFNRLVPGQRYSLVIRDGSGCFLEQDWLMPAGTPGMVQLPPILNMRLGTSIELTPILHIPESLIASIRWVPNEGLSCFNCLNPTLTALTNTTYTLRLIDVFGCSEESSMELIVDPAADIFVPSAFSPNGDGNNDLLVVFANPIQVRKIVSFQIFDRWGALLYRSAHIPPNTTTTGWDGTMKGTPLDSGLYVYLLQVELTNGTIRTFSGETVLLR